MRHTLGRTPLDEGSVRSRDLYRNTQQSQETDIHAPNGIRTSYPSKRATADLCGHWGQPKSDGGP